MAKRKPARLATATTTAAIPVIAPAPIIPPPRPIHSVNDLLPVLGAAFGPDETLWFRGHADAINWTLVPSVARAPCTLGAEMTIIKRFQQNAYPFLVKPPREEWEWLFLIQHYGAPTRLLDWTESPLVALYFAVSDTKHDAVDGCIWSLLPHKLNEYARLKSAFPHDILSFGNDAELQEYLPTKIHTTTSRHSNVPVAAIAPRQFERVTAQLGVFTIIHRDPLGIETIDNGSLVRKFIIPRGAKANIRRELTVLRITQLSIFPELANVALQAMKGLW